MRYSIEVSQNKYGVLKIIVLALCIIADLAAIAGIVGALSSKRYADIAIYAVIMLAVLAVQCSATFLTYKVKYQIDEDDFSIYKIYPLKKCEIVKTKAGGVSLKAFEGNSSELKTLSADKNTVILCVNTCPYAIYVLELSGKKYLINLDDYLYAKTEEKR